jgi:hypothetical protein
MFEGVRLQAAPLTRPRANKLSFARAGAYLFFARNFLTPSYIFHTTADTNTHLQNKGSVFSNAPQLAAPSPNLYHPPH